MTVARSQLPVQLRASQKQIQRRAYTVNETHRLQATTAPVKMQTSGCRTIRVIRTSIKSTSEALRVVTWLPHHRGYPTIAHREITTSKRLWAQAGNGSRRTHPSSLLTSRSKKKSWWANHSPTKTELLRQNRCSNRLVPTHDTGVTSSHSEPH